MQNSIQIKSIENSAEWDKFLGQNKNRYFLQAWHWGDFNEKGLKKKVWRLGFYSDSDLVGICLAIEEKSRFGNFVYCPRGPIFDWENKGLAKEIFAELSDFFKGKGLGFLRIDPAIVDNSSEPSCLLRTLGYRDAAKFVQVERAWMLDIAGKSDEELLSGMRKTARYYLKKAIKKGVKVRISEDPKDLELFINMIQEMAKRKGFPALSSDYYRKEFEIFGSKGYEKILVAEYQNEPVATAFIVFYGNEGSYLHAASTDKYPEVQAPYLVQWEAIKYAREKGLKRYNFWGVVEDKDYHPGYPGFGYSNFKRGFGGYLETYMRTKDYVYSWPRYQLYRLQEIYRKWRYKGN